MVRPSLFLRGLFLDHGNWISEKGKELVFIGGDVNPVEEAQLS